LLRQRVADEDARKKIDKTVEKDEMDADTPLEEPSTPAVVSSSKDADMEVDDGSASKHSTAPAEQERKEDTAAMDDDDAVEY